MPDIKYLPLSEFIDSGLLQEVNRLVLHPVGLVLEVLIDGPTGLPTRLGGIQDHRDTPDGVYFAEARLSAEKAKAVCDLVMARRGGRIKHLGWVVQPIPDERVLTTNYTQPAPDGIEFEQ